MSRLSFSLPFLGISRKKRIAFYTQLEYMLDAGIPPVRSLRAAAEREGSARFRKVILAMADHIEAGGSLTSAFDQHPAIFPPLERRMMGAAERGGNISRALSVIARFQTDMRHLWVRFWMDMIYPGILLFTALVVCPMLKAVFLGGVENLMASLAWNAARLLAILLIVIVVFRWLNSMPFTRGVLHRIALRLPLFGKAFHRLAKTNFAKALASLYVSGLPVREAYRESAKSSGNEIVTRRLADSARVLEEGGNLSQAIAASGQFDAMALGMISTGEESGKLDFMLNKYADFEEQEAVNQLKILSKTLPMFIYFLVACYIVYIIFTFYMHYFSMIA